jgi:hypothetical protein
MQRIAETCKHLWVPGPTTVCVDREPLTATCLCRSFSTLLCLQPHQQLCSTENCRKRAAAIIWEDLDLPYTWGHKTSVCRLPSLPCSCSIFKKAILLIHQVSATNCLERTTNSSTAEEPIAPLSGQNWWPNTLREYFPSAWGKRTKHIAEIAHMGVERLSRPCGESQALNCLAETGSKLKLTVWTREKLICNTQACPVSGSTDDCSFNNYHGTTSENLPFPEAPLH